MYVCEHGHIPKIFLTKFETQVLTSAAVLWKKPTQFSKMHYFMCTSFSDVILDNRCGRDQISILTNLSDPVLTVQTRAVTVLVQSRV
jgi:hypothetical protein